MNGPQRNDRPGWLGHVDHSPLPHIWVKTRVSRHASATARARDALEGFYTCGRTGCEVSRFGKEPKGGDE